MSLMTRICERIAPAGRHAVRAVRIVLVLVVSTAVVIPAQALSPEEQLKDPALEARARELAAELRCLVCQNQSIDDSDAPLAKDLRRLVRERLVAGDSNSDVKQFLVNRYGDFVLLKPPFAMKTLLLWLAPFLVLLATITYVVRAARMRPSVANRSALGLSVDEEARLADLMRSSSQENGASSEAGR